MSGGPSETQLARIEAALLRIERATERARAQRQAIEDRHARLRDSVGEALAELDQLIAEQRA